MKNINALTIINIDGIVTSVPRLTAGNLVEFVVTDDDRREFVIRIARQELGGDVQLGSRVMASGAEGWVIPGRSWRDEPSRTIVQAHDVQLRELAFAA